MLSPPPSPPPLPQPNTPLKSDLVLPRPGDVAHPPLGLVPDLVVHLEEPDVDAAGGEHGHLELQGDGRLGPGPVVSGGHQVQLRC